MTWKGNSGGSFRPVDIRDGQNTHLAKDRPSSGSSTAQSLTRFIFAETGAILLSIRSALRRRSIVIPMLEIASKYVEFFGRIGVQKCVKTLLLLFFNINPSQVSDSGWDNRLAFYVLFTSFPEFFFFSKDFCWDERGEMKLNKNVALTISNWPCKQLVMQVQGPFT